MREPKDGDRELPKSRALPSSLPSSQWTVETTISKETCLSLEENHFFFRVLGIVAGFPLRLRVKKVKKEDGSGHTFGVKYCTFGVGVQRGGQLLSDVDAHVSLSLSYGVTAKRRSFSLPLRDNFYRGTDDFFGVAWQTIMEDHSPYFNDEGRMKVTTTVVFS